MLVFSHLFNGCYDTRWLCGCLCAVVKCVLIASPGFVKVRLSSVHCHQCIVIITLWSVCCHEYNVASSLSSVHFHSNIDCYIVRFLLIFFLSVHWQRIGAVIEDELTNILKYELFTELLLSLQQWWWYYSDMTSLHTTRKVSYIPTLIVPMTIPIHTLFPLALCIVPFM